MRTLSKCIGLGLLMWLIGVGNASAQSNASFVSFQPPPGNMVTSQTVSVSVTMYNNGGSAWIENQGFRLGAWNPQDNTQWGLNRVNMSSGAVVNPGQSYTFSFQVTAPTTPGTYAWEWRMVHEWVQWFGEASPTIWVTVQPPTEYTSCPAANPDDYSPDDGAINTCISQGGTVTLKASHSNPGYIIASGLSLNTAGVTIQDNGVGGRVWLVADETLDAPMLQVGSGVNGWTLSARATISTPDQCRGSMV